MTPGYLLNLSKISIGTILHLYKIISAQIYVNYSDRSNFILFNIYTMVIVLPA